VDELRRQLVATWAEFQQRTVYDGTKNSKHVSMQKVGTLNTGCDIACLIFQLPHITTSSFQTHQHLKDCNKPVAHLYADDTQIYSASGPSDVGALLQKITGCLTAVADWMSANRLQLNSDKTEFTWLTSPRSQHRLPTSGPLIDSNVVSPSATVRDLSVFIDQDLTMKTQVQQTASRCFATLCQL